MPPLQAGATEPAYDPATAEQRVHDKVAEIQQEEGRIRAEAERRIAEAEQRRREAGARIEPTDTTQSMPPPVPPGLQGAKQDLQRGREEQDRSMTEAERRLTEIEERTRAAEKRAAEAQRLAALHADEEERERRLKDLRDSVAQAEERAREAERRAAEAEQAVMRSVSPGAAQPGVQREAHVVDPQPQAPGMQPPAPPGPPQPGPPPPPTPEPPAPPAPEPPSAAAGPTISLNSVSFEQLRSQGLSVTQATRLLAHRERIGSFQSLDDLDEVPGFPKDQVEDLKRRSEL